MMDTKKVFSPTQAALGVFLGGPISSIYFLKQNFEALNNAELVKKTIQLGTLIVAMILLILPFLPENFPGFIIPVVTIVTTRLLIERLQFKKQDIIDNEELEFESNWRVFAVGLISLLVMSAIIFVYVLLLETMGI